MKARKQTILLACLILAACLLGGCASNQEQREPTIADKYEEAVILLQENRFSEAADAFEGLGYYRDASKYAMYCRALDSMHNSTWSEAVLTLVTLDDFMDSRILATYCSGRILEDNEQYEEALDVYSGLMQYGDVGTRSAAIPEKILAREYRKAGELENSGSLEKALAAFTALGAYSDSAKRAQAIQDRLDQIALEKLEEAYQAALLLESQGDYLGAYNAFIALGDYADSAGLAAKLKPEADYRAAYAAAEEGEYLKAQRLYAELGDYKDAPEKARLLLVYKKADSTGSSRLAAGIYRYQINGKYGFIDLKENRDVSPAWDSLNIFSEKGLAVAAVGSEFRLINQRGQSVSSSYSSIRSGSIHFYIAALSKGWSAYSYTLLDAEGRILSSGWANVQPFSESYALVQRESDGLWGYIDQTGSVVIEPQYLSAKAFSEGIAPVQSSSGWAYITPDNTAALQLDSGITDADPFSDGLALVRNKDLGLQVIDRQGTLLLFKENVYQAAENTASSGDLEGAITLFESLNGYADSNDQALQAREKINRQIYERAEEYENNGQLEQAAETFEWLGSYSDAAARASAARKAILANTYAAAQALADAGKPEEAISMYLSLGDYLDSADRAVQLRDGINQGILDQAERLFEKGQKAEAINSLLDIAGWKDVDSRIAEMYTDYLNDYIDRAQALENGERYEDAIREYRALDDEKGNASAYFENLRNDPSQADEFARLSPLYDMLKSIAVGDDTRQRIAADEEKIRERDYSTAEAMERNQQYEEAAAAFCALGDWKDAQARAEANLKTLSEYRRHYDSAAALEEAMDFENAIVAFEALGAFSDAADRAEAARESLESFRSLYEAAERMEAEEQYEAAFTAFTGLGTFADSADRALRVKEKAMEQVREHAYASAEALEEESQFEEAIDAFMALGDYRDSAERITLIREKIRVRDYASAKEALEEDRFQEALALLKTLGDYQDSSALLNEAQTGIRYENALNLALDGNISNALSEFTALADYRDSAVKAGILSNLKLADKAQQIVPGVLIYQFHGLWGLANLNTNVSVPAKYSAITYAEGTQYRELDLLNVFIQGAADEKNYYGYMDLNGSEVIPCRFYAVSDFDEHGRCTVVEAHIVHPNYYYYSRLYFGIMDRDGNVITEPQWQTMGASGNVGSSGHSNWTSSWSSEMFYMNSLYFTVSLPVFTEGRMKVQDTDQGLWGCIDESGRILGDGVKWNGIGDFSDGMAKVKLNGKYGFINADGVQVGDVRWDTVKDFSSGYAGVQENGKWGFIDHGNTLVIPCRYLEVNDFKVNDNGECTCDVKKEDGTWDVINTAGESVLYGN